MTDEFIGWKSMGLSFWTGMRSKRAVNEDTLNQTGRGEAQVKEIDDPHCSKQPFRTKFRLQFFLLLFF